MKITFAVIVCILFCGTEANDFKATVKFCQSAKEDLPTGTKLPVLLFCELPHQAYKPELKLIACLSNVHISEYNYHHFTVYQPSELYAGKTLRDAKTIVADTANEDKIPYIIEEVEDGTLHYRLKEVKVEACYTRCGSSTGIRFTAVFEKDRCRLHVATEVVTLDPMYGNKVAKIVEKYLKLTNFVTEEFTGHNIKWIEEAYETGRLIKSDFKDDYWTQEYTIFYHFLAERQDIHTFLKTMGLYQLEDEQRCKRL